MRTPHPTKVSKDKNPSRKITIRVHDCRFFIKGEDPGPHLLAIGYMPDGEELVRGTIRAGHSPSVQADAAAELAGWIKKHRPGWGIETTPSEGVILHER